MFLFNFNYIKTIFHFFKKITLVIVVLSIVLSFMLHFIQKNKPQLSVDPIQRNRNEIYKLINDQELNKTSEGKLRIQITRIISCKLIGEACSDNPNDGNKNYNKSLLGFFSNLILIPFMNPPSSGVFWVYDGLQNAGFVPKIYASEGIGFGAIKAFSSIWVAFRDISYTILVLVIIVIGFMIMFRMKLNPQTVISVENSLPKIVISLILITFSFAIAGFLIDLMYVACSLVISLLGPSYKFNTTGEWFKGAKDINELQQQYLQAGPEQILWGISKNNSNMLSTILWEVPNAVLNLVPEIGGAIRLLGSIIGFYFIFPYMWNNFPGPQLSALLNIPIAVPLRATPVGVGVGADFSLGKVVHLLTHFPLATSFLGISIWLGSAFLIPLIVGLLILLTVILIFCRIFLMLLTSYAKILLSVIISPIYLLQEAIPGQHAFSNWIKGLIAELITFPVIITMFIMGTIVSDKASLGATIQFPFMWGVDPNSFALILGLLILFITPDFVIIVKKMFVPKPGPFDQVGIGTLFGGATQGISTGLGEMQKYAGMGYYIKPISDILGRIPGASGLFNQPGGGHPPGH